MNDLRLACRRLRLQPTFAAIVVLTLALGIAAVTIVFAWIDRVLLNALPGVSQPRSLAALVTESPFGVGDSMSYPNLRDAGRAGGIAGVAGASFGMLHLQAEGGDAWTWAEMVTEDFFAVLGVRARAGSLQFTPGSDERPGSAREVVISERLWRDRFGSDPNVVGRVLHFNRQITTVIGVADGEFRGSVGGLSFDAWVPLSMQPQLGLAGPHDQRAWNFLRTLVRLEPGTSLREAGATLRALSDRLKREFPGSLQEQQHFTAVPLWKCPWGGPSVFLPLLQALGLMAVLVLLLVVANLSSLAIARATGGEQEWAVRLALGARRGDVVRQWVVEGLVLATAGGVAGILVSLAGVRLLSWFIPTTQLPVGFDLSVTLPVAALGLGVSLLAGLVLAAAPAWQSARTCIATGLGTGARGTDGARSRLRVRRLLVVVQGALAVTLLVAAVHCVGSFRTARHLDLGFQPEGVWTTTFRPAAVGWDRAQSDLFFDRLHQALAAQPGVAAVGFADTLPLGFEGGASGEVTVPGEPARAERQYAGLVRVSPGYFEALSIPLIRGRWFDPRDSADAPARAVINETLARRYLSGRDPLGAQITIWGRTLEVIGVARNGKYRELREGEQAHVWVPLSQWENSERMLVVRMQGDPAAAPAVVRAALRQVTPAAPNYGGMTLEQFVSPAFFVPRMAAILLGILSAVALTLAVLGLYAVIEFLSRRRQREMAVRLAVGARPAQVRNLLLAQGLRLAAAGLVLGLLLGWLAAHGTAQLLVGVSPGDVRALAMAAAVLAVAATAGCWIPARRAARLSPMSALKRE